MINDTLRLLYLKNQPVWITAYPTEFLDSDTNTILTNGYVCAFRIGEEPRLYDGEYLKDESGKLKIFDDINSAICAANKAAFQKLCEDQ